MHWSERPGVGHLPPGCCASRCRRSRLGPCLERKTEIALVGVANRVPQALTLRTDGTSVLVGDHCLDERVVRLPLGIRTAVDQAQLGGGRVRAAGVADEGGALGRGR